MTEMGPVTGVLGELASEIIEENLTAICLATPDGVIRECNAAFVRLFGFASATGTQGDTLSRLFPAGGLPALVSRLRHERIIRSEPAQLRRADGRPLAILHTAIGQFNPRPFNPHGPHELQGFVLLATDDTARQTLETHLRDVMRMETVGRLASAMAHDFSNLLMVINGLAESLLERLTTEDPRRPECRQLLEASHRAQTLTMQLLAASRKPAGLPTMFDLDDVVRTMAPLIERLAGPQVRVLLELSPGAKQISADRDQLEQVLLNLVTNARDAMPNGGLLTLRSRIERADAGDHREGLTTATAAEPGDRVVLMMSDTGTGMPPEVRAHIFEPFFTTKPRGKGTGMGLWQVQSILAEHHGSIDVRSEPERGTTFVLRLPRAGSAGTPASPGASEASIATPATTPAPARTMSNGG